jgi:ATP-dependent HslUV protease ATP-binding subunit HslU
VKAKAHDAAEERVIEAIAGKDAREQTREMFRRKLRRRARRHDDRARGRRHLQPDAMNDGYPRPARHGQMGMMNLGDIFGKAFGGRTRKRR